jgi:UDPglucose 6-dehydrogenase
MVKHTINSFLALSVAFINEIATVCEQVNADAHEVSVGVKSDRRIGCFKSV